MPGKTVTVTNATQLLTAARAAKAGDTILLAPVNFGDVVLSNINPSGLITIKSADPDNDAVFRTLNTQRVSNLVFDDINIHRPLAPGAAQNTFLANINGNNLTFVGINVSGSLNGSALDDGHGMMFTGSHISVLNSTFEQLNTAVATRGDNFLFAGNTVTEVREGVGITSMTGAVFANNYMANWQPNYAAGEHPDMFQVQSGRSNFASSDLIFRNNIMLPGSAGPVGGIFIRSEAVGRGERHENIIIENNYYEGAYRHAITVANADDVTIRGNTVLMGNNSGLVPAINLTDVRGGLVESNISPLLLESRTLPNTGIGFSNNVDVWDTKTKKGILATELFSPSSGDDIDFNRFNAVSTSTAGRVGAGFSAVADIGHLSGSSAAQIAAWLPVLDQHLAIFL